MSSTTSGPNCWQCRHFQITHLPATPYACRFMGFQSRWLPSLEVLRADGQHCLAFSPKPAGPSDSRHTQTDSQDSI